MEVALPDRIGDTDVIEEPLQGQFLHSEPMARMASYETAECCCNYCVDRFKRQVRLKLALFPVRQKARQPIKDAEGRSRRLN